MAAINIFLDTRRAVAGGLYPIKFSIYHAGKQRNIPSGISVALNQWKEGRIVGHPQRAVWNNLLNRRLADFNDALAKVSARRVVRLMSCEELKEELIKEMDPLSVSKVEASPDFFQVLQEFVGTHTRQRTQHIYGATAISIRKYMASQEPPAEGLTFRDITRKWLTNYDQWMEAQGNKTNSRAIHLRNIRAVYNYAISEEIVGQEGYPFRSFSIKMEATFKRSLSLADLRTLFNFRPVNKYDIMALDVFKLTFFLIGINIVDLYNLKAADYVNGRITYRRAKTGHIYDIMVLPEAAELIAKYRAPEGSERLLLFHGRCIGGRETYDHYTSLRAVVNDHLQLIAKQLNLPAITTYWARHSWATLAADFEVPKETISKALGHAAATVTDVYIKFNEAKVDEANRRIVAAVTAYEHMETLEEALAKVRDKHSQECPF